MLSVLEAPRKGLVGVAVKVSGELDFALFVDLVVVFAFFLGDDAIAS